MLIKMQDFEVVLGIDWLYSNYVVVEFWDKRVKFMILGKELVFQGRLENQINNFMLVISAMRVIGYRKRM